MAKFGTITVKLDVSEINDTTLVRCNKKACIHNGFFAGNMTCALKRIELNDNGTCLNAETKQKISLNNEEKHV